MNTLAIDLVAQREPDLVGGGRDFLIYARGRRVGRIYEVTSRPDHAHWFWGLQGIFTSMEIGQLQWALAAPEAHLSYARIRKDLEDVGVAGIESHGDDVLEH